MQNSREFTAPYVFQEYPKWVTLADGSQLIVHNADEEQVAVGPKADDEGDDAGDAAQGNRVALFEQARALGLNPHHRTGEEKLAEMIKNARGE